MATTIGTEPLATPAAPALTQQMTYEEFLARADGDTYTEWVNGEVVYMSPVSNEHQAVGLFLLNVISCFVEVHNLSVVRYDPFQMKTGPNLPGRAPDILFVATPNLSRLKSTYLDGPADLVVEIISPDSRARDRGEKFYEYEQGSVREYWLLDYLRRQAEFYQRGPDGIFRPVPAAADGIYHSAVLESLWLWVEWLWQEPLPPLLTVLREWRLV